MAQVMMGHPNLPGQWVEIQDEAMAHYSHGGWYLKDDPEAPWNATRTDTRSPQPEPDKPAVRTRARQTKEVKE